MRDEVLRYGRIRDLRTDRGLSQRQVAEVLNVKQNTYSQYETGALHYPVEALIRLARYYNTSVDYLLGLTNDPAPYPRTK